MLRGRPTPAYRRLGLLVVAPCRSQWRIGQTKPVHVKRLVAASTVEERMLRYQRECDERAQSEIAIATKRFRDSALVRARMDERARYRAELERARDELAQEHRERLARLKSREADVHSRALRVEQDAEAMSLNQ